VAAATRFRPRRRLRQPVPPSACYDAFAVPTPGNKTAPAEGDNSSGCAACNRAALQPSFTLVSIWHVSVVLCLCTPDYSISKQCSPELWQTSQVSKR
jgi:hypothetical protein